MLLLQITNAHSVLGCVRLGQQHFASISHQSKWIAKQRRSRTVVLQELIENLSVLSLPGEVFGYCIASEKISLLKFGWKLFLVFLNCSVTSSMCRSWLGSEAVLGRTVPKAALFVFDSSEVNLVFTQCLLKKYTLLHQGRSSEQGKTEGV